MSDIAINLQDQLRQNGLGDAVARSIAQSFDRQVEEILRAAKAHSDRNRAETEEKIKAHAEQVKAHAENTKAQMEVLKAREAQFVSAAKYYERDKTLATREDIAQLRAEFRADMAQQREEFRADMAQQREEFRAEIAELRREMNTGFQRIFIGGFIMFAGGFGAIIAKLYFGV